MTALGRGGRCFCRWLALVLVLLNLAWETSARAEEPRDLAEMRRLFAEPPDDARIMVRWWWFGPAVTKPEISRELRAMQAAGIGGVELQSVYPLALDDAAAGLKNLPFLSDEHIDALRHANHEARALGLRVDLTLGSGWPFGGPAVPIEQAAARLRVERTPLRGGETRVRVPSLGAGEQLVAAQAVGAPISPENTRELTPAADGTVDLSPDKRDAREVLFFISSRTRQQVKRASVGAEGLVMDHYDPAAVDAYLHHVGDRLLEAFGDQPPYAVFCDSLEVYLADWTPDLLAQFQKRRGYDLQPYLPALVADIGPRTAAIRHDWGETLTELLAERFVQPLHDWAARHHTRFRFQGYGTPPAALSTGRLADLPEGEGAQWRSLGAARWASSTSHLYGRPVTSSETWTWVHSPAFRATPLDLKAEADLHFLQGVNQLIGHGWPYSAPGAGYPGWRFYAAGALNDQNPWWLVMPDLTRYLQRASYLLRQGQPANDVALYLPTSDAWAQFHDKQVNLFETLRQRLGKDVVATILDAGYNCDFFDDEALRTVGKVEPGALVMGANRYKIVVLPDVERIPLETLRKLADFARRGGRVIATRRLPESAPGFQATAAEQDEVQKLTQILFTGSDATARLVTDEKTALATQLAAAVSPDVIWEGDQTNLGFVHRHTADAEIYFVANTGPVPRRVKATFRVDAKHAERWDPFTGESVPIVSGPDGHTLPLELEAYASQFLVFTNHPGPVQPPSPPPFAAGIAPLDLSADWTVSFADGHVVTMDKLRSWAADEATRYYSGLATYERTFDVPTGRWPAGTRALLDFGPTKPLPVKSLPNGTRAWVDPPVCEAALVFLNGQQIGAVWHPPYTLDVTRALSPGTNRLKIVVGNTAINHLAAAPPPDYQLLNLRYGERFKAQDMDALQPLPSGLLGPIRLIPAASENGTL